MLPEPKIGPCDCLVTNATAGARVLTAKPISRWQEQALLPEEMIVKQEGDVL